MSNKNNKLIIASIIAVVVVISIIISRETSFSLTKDGLSFFSASKKSDNLNTTTIEQNTNGNNSAAIIENIGLDGKKISQTTAKDHSPAIIRGSAAEK